MHAEERKKAVSKKPVYHPEKAQIVREKFQGVQKGIQSLTKDSQKIGRSSEKNQRTGSFLNQIGSKDDVQRIWQNYREAAPEQESEDFVLTSLVLNLVPEDEVDKGVELPQDARELLHSTQFLKKFTRYVQGSSVIARRWPILAQVLQAHMRGDYFLTVPALFSQLEGMISEALVLRTLVKTEGHKMYERASDGSFRVDQYGNRIELRGLSQLLELSDAHNDPSVRGVTAMIVRSFSGARNGVMHGRELDYGTEPRSTQLLLLVYLLCGEFYEYEHGEL